jgi:hypothetical protein
MMMAFEPVAASSGTLSPPMEIRYRKDWGTDLLVDDKTGGKMPNMVIKGEMISTIRNYARAAGF